MIDLSKSEKRELRSLACEAYRVMLRQPETMVARALAVGLIGHDRVSAEVEEKLAHLVQF